MSRIVAYILICVLLGTACASEEEGITVKGAGVLRNGETFRIHGVQLMTFVAPIDYLTDPPAESCRRGQMPPCPFTAYVNAYRQYGPDLLSHAKEFGANTILFKVSEPGLDELDPFYSEHYVDELVEGVKLARSQGFVVILGIQETRVSGEPGPKGTRNPIPDEGTLRAAVKLAKLFGTDREVLIELYMEPYARGRVADFWDYYIFGSNGFPGVNKIIREMRAAGSRNVIIVQALGQNFKRYNGGIEDPLEQLAFGLHAYFHAVGTERSEWDSHYGDFAADHPLIVTEWNQSSTQIGENRTGREIWCEKTPMNRPLEMFHYFDEKGIDGAIGWAFDLPSTIVKDYRGTPRSLTGFACGKKGGGIGDLFQHYFAGTLPPLVEEKESSNK
jgi:hypothetical protein